MVLGEEIIMTTLAELEIFFSSFQQNNRNIEKECPLCNLNLTEEHIRYNGRKFLVLDTKNKKGHKERIMVIIKKHGVNHPKKLLYRAIQQLIIEGKKIFPLDFILMGDKFSSVNSHWHIVASDTDPNADDYKQVMDTPFILILNIHKV